jgi:hypothetical protein
VKHLDAACAKTGRPGLKSLATELYARQKQFRRERAVAQIRKHGGQVAGSAIDGGGAAGFEGGFLPFAGPAIIFDGPIVEMEAAAIPVPAAEVEPELPRGEVFDLFAEIGRAIGRAIAPGGLEPPAVAEPKLDEPKAEAAVKEAAEAATDLAKAVEEATKAAKDAAEAVPLAGSEPAPRRT